MINNVYRNKALKALEKRNATLGNESEYLNMLCNMNVGDNVSVSGNMSEANFFNYIADYCQMEMMVAKRNMTLGNVSTTIEEKLKNPPDEYKDAYDAVSDLYDAYISLTNCATDPSGSLQTYSSTFNDADTNTLNAYKAMELYLDD